MKLRVLALAAMLAMFFHGAAFAQTDAETWNNMGVQYYKKGNFAKAIECFLQVKSITEKTQDKENPNYTALLNNLGFLYNEIGDYAKAERFYLDAAAIQEKVLGKGHPDYAITLNNLGTLYNDMGDYKKAERYYLDTAAIQEKVLGKGHPDYALSLNNLGLLYNITGDYTKAERYYLEATAIYEKTLGKAHPDYATSLNNLGALYADMGDYAKTERYYLDAAAVREKALGKEHPYYARSLNNLGFLYNEIGDYAKAERYYLDASVILEKVLGKGHPDYATSLNNIGALYHEMGDYKKAERYYLDASAIREKALGKDHPDYAVSLNNLGALYNDMGDYKKAERYYLDASAIREKALGKDHPDYAVSLDNLGALYNNMGDYKKAERYKIDAVAIMEKALGKEHPYYAKSLNSMGLLYNDIGDFVKAEHYHLAAKTIWEKTMGKEHPYYAVLLDNLYALYLRKKEYAKALVYKQEQINILTGFINKNFSFQTEQQREAYWNANSSSFESIYSLSFYNPVAASNILNYDNALFSKGLLLRTTNAMRDAIYASGNKTLIAQFEELGALRQQINALRQKEGSSEVYIQSLEAQAETLEKSLTQSSTAFRELKADLGVNWQSVQKSLQTKEAAIEFVSFRIYDKGWMGKTQYAALLLKKDSKAPAWILLCDEKTLQEILGRAEGRTPERQARSLYDNNGLELFNITWKPIENELKGVTTVYYSPSGLFHKIAFNALPVDESRNTRLADKYNLNLVSSTREVVHLDRSPTKTTQITSAVLYGGLDYDANVAAMRKAAQVYKNEAAVSSTSAPPAGVTRGGAWVSLPATKEETLNIQKYLNSKKIPNTLYQGSLGNEESFMRLDGKKTGLIHLATHGFFLPDPERKNDDTQQQQTQQRSGALKPIDNPLLRSGLLLAGGNHAWTNKPVAGVESGILTAEKIAGMNLLGAKLVVMSACQTGLGDVKNGEGVFGLQRAFKLAGVETLVMSLWEVSDEATAKLMSTFYQEWLISGKRKQEAFKEAQKKVRAEYPAPFYWAAFVMMD